MSRYTGPKFKLSRREGVNLTGTTSPRLEGVLKTLPGGRERRRTQSGYSLRLRAKQCVRAQYGATERGFRRLLGIAEKLPGPTGRNLLQLLERRLGSVVYRLGLARTRPALPFQVFLSGPENPSNSPSMRKRFPWWRRKCAPAAFVLHGSNPPMREDESLRIRGERISTPRENLIVEFYAR